MTIWFPLRALFQRPSERAAWPVPQLAEPEEDTPARPLSPMAVPIHVLSDEALVRARDGALLVERPGQATFSRPIELVSSVHVYGRPGITSPCVGQLLNQGTPVVWRSHNGYPIGLSMPLHMAGLDARRAQYDHADGPRGLEIAQRLIAAKITSMRGLVRRRVPHEAGALNSLSSLSKRAKAARAIETLLGYEGAAAALYFSLWPLLLSDHGDDMIFDGRTRRPPRDEINAALSYAYAVLAGECLAAVAAAGLDPRCGVLHRPRSSRPALALDLLEPFRPIIADQVVLTAFNTAQLHAEHFETSDTAASLNDAGRRRILDLLEARLATSIAAGASDVRTSYRETIGLQAKAIAAALSGATNFVAMERP